MDEGVGKLKTKRELILLWLFPFVWRMTKVAVEPWVVVEALEDRKVGVTCLYKG